MILYVCFMTLAYYHYKIYCYGLLKHILNYENKLFYICQLSLLFIIFPDVFHVFQCLVHYMVHYCFFIFFKCFVLFFPVVFSMSFLRVLSVFYCVFGFSIVFQVLSPVYIVLLNVFICFICFNFNVLIVFSSEMFIAFPFFQVLFIVFD